MKFPDLSFLRGKKILLPFFASLIGLLLTIFSNFAPLYNVTPKDLIASHVSHETEVNTISHDHDTVPAPSTRLVSNYNQAGLYIYTWTDFCHQRIDILKSWALFPYYPIQDYSVISNLGIEVNPSGKYAERVFGYLKPPITGMYAFRANKKQHIEIWVSPNESPENTVLVLDGEDATPIMLEREVYCYIEIFYTIVQRYNRTTLIEWQLPEMKRFVRIKSDYLFSDPKLIKKGTKHSQENLPHFHFNGFQKQAEQPDLFKYPSLPNNEFQLYKDCGYSPSFARKRKIRPLYQGVNEITNMWLTSYPNDGTSFGSKYSGNGIVSVVEVNKVFNDFKTKLLERREDIESVNLANFQKQLDPIKGSRYLIEALITLSSDKEDSFRFSYHVYQPNVGPLALCHPSSLHIQLDTFVYIAVTVKNQGHWLRYFVENMEQIYEVTRDERFGMIIVDFESDDVDTVELVHNSRLPHKHLITLKGAYSRSMSFNKAIDYVKNDGDIIFACDLQLDMPVDIIDLIRTHTFRGVSGYAPVTFRLDCGNTIEAVMGKWEVLGYGIFSMFKADWTIVGGFDEVRYKYDWGGEDWELLDRFLENGYFLERFRHPLLFHYFHDRKKMWKH